MDIVIQCAATKVPHAGAFRALDGRKVRFVAQPKLSAPDKNIILARPDDASDVPNETWRSRLTKYVAQYGQDNPFELLKAYQLYTHKAYAALVRRFGEQHVFVLSAGWGLVRADYLTPAYDVTFNRRAKLKKPEAFCDSTSTYKYFRQVPEGSGPIVFLGGRDYLALFERLTVGLRRERIAFLRADEQGVSSLHGSRTGIKFEPYRVAAKTNWHYQCALALAQGKISLEAIQ